MPKRDSGSDLSINFQLVQSTSVASEARVGIAQELMLKEKAVIS